MIDKEDRVDNLNAVSDKVSLEDSFTKELLLEEIRDSERKEGSSLKSPIAATESSIGISQTGSEYNRELEQLIFSIDGEIAEADRNPLTGLEEAEKDTPALTEQYVVFSMSDVRYAVPIANVLEVGRVPAITHVPNVPNWLMGVTNIRGEIVSVIDLGIFLGIERAGRIDTSRILVVRAGEDAEFSHAQKTQFKDEITTALIVDGVSGIISLSDDRIESPTAAIEDKISQFLRGVHERGKEFIVVLDLERFLILPEVCQFR